MAARSRAETAGSIPVQQATRDAVVALSKARGEPPWLLRQRLEAWEALSQRATSRQEPAAKTPWLTDLTSLRLERLAAIVPYIPAGVLSPAAGSRSFAAEARFADILAPEIAVSPAGDTAGLVVSELAAAARDMPDRVRPFLGRVATSESNTYTNLTTAFWRSGLFVYVPAGVEVALPIRATLRVATPVQAFFWRVLVVAEPGSKVTLVEESVSPARAGGSLFAGLTELVVGNGATVEYVTVERWGHGFSSLVERRATVGKAGVVRWLGAHLGSELTRSTVAADLAGEGARAEAVGLFVAGERQQTNLSVQLWHSAPHTSSSCQWYGAVGDSAHAELKTQVRVKSGAEGTDVESDASVLTLGSLARVDLAPRLQIERKDAQVKQHTAVRRLDERRVQTLVGAGVPRSQATLSLVCDNLAPAVARFPAGRVRHFLEREIARKGLS